MAKPKPKKAVSAGGNRRDKLANFEAARKKDQRRRTIILLAVCVALAMALLAYPVILFVDNYRAQNADIATLGPDAAAAACTPPEENPATGNQQHEADGTAIPYDRRPPDSGPHYNTWADFTRKFYTVEDRPAVGNIVHNLEHGYAVIWYRDTMPADQIETLRKISLTFGNDDYATDKFIAAPWSEADGGGMPDGKNIVMTHWYAPRDDPANTTLQKGIRSSCAEVSGAAIKDFMAKYPSVDSPEPNGG